MHFSIDRTVHTTAFDKPVVDHWLERKIAQTAVGSTEKDRSDDVFSLKQHLFDADLTANINELSVNKYY